MNLLLDTNILVLYSRHDELAERMETALQLMSGSHDLFISIVTIGEIEAVIHKTGIGPTRQRRLRGFIHSNKITKITIEHGTIYSNYGIIDAISQAKLRRSDSEFTSRNMGKNDLWIAATAATFDLTLVTTDKDFDHLAEHYIDLRYVDIGQYK